MSLVRLQEFYTQSQRVHKKLENEIKKTTVFTIASKIKYLQGDLTK